MKDKIIEMARQSGMMDTWDGWVSRSVYKASGLQTEDLEAFSKLVEARASAKEREACAKLVEDSWMAFSRASNRRLDITPFPELEYVAKVIRARGNNANSM